MIVIYLKYLNGFLVIKLTPLIVLLTACGHIKQLDIHHII